MTTTRREFVLGSAALAVCRRLCKSRKRRQVPQVRKTELWFATPASRWMEALPLGNGRIGAMVYGGAATRTLRPHQKSTSSGRARRATTTLVLQRWSNSLASANSCSMASSQREANSASSIFSANPIPLARTSQWRPSNSLSMAIRQRMTIADRSVSTKLSHMSSTQTGISGSSASPSPQTPRTSSLKPCHLQQTGIHQLHRLVRQAHSPRRSNNYGQQSNRPEGERFRKPP